MTDAQLKKRCGKCPTAGEKPMVFGAKHAGFLDGRKNPDGLCMPCCFFKPGIYFTLLYSVRSGPWRRPGMASTGSRSGSRSGPWTSTRMTRIGLDRISVRSGPWTSTRDGFDRISVVRSNVKMCVLQAPIGI